MRITSKTQFFEEWEAGKLGNRPYLFRDGITAYQAKFPFYGFRELGQAGGGKWMLIPREHVIGMYHLWKLESKNFIIDSAIYPATDDNITLQGEVCRTIRGWEGNLGYCRGYKMRPAMITGLLKPRSASETLVLINTYMDPSSVEDLRALLDLYPDATVEFTCFDRDLGIIPGRNTIFWETRDY